MSAGKNETESPGLRIKRLVSKAKRSRQRDMGVELDLSYITPKLIAMSFPSSGVEVLYRNCIDDVVDFFNKRHKEHYMVYNLCVRTYDHKIFDDRVIRFPIINDLSVPQFDDITLFNDAINEWLTDSNENIAVLHNKNGKGSVGFIIVTYLLYNNTYKCALDAIKYFNITRCNNPLKGITNPSQIRYAKYYEKLMIVKRSNEKALPKPKRYKIDRIFLSKNTPKFSMCVIKCEANKSTDQLHTLSAKEDDAVSKEHDGWYIIPREECTVMKDFNIEFKSGGLRKSKLFSCWLYIEWECHKEDALHMLIYGYLRQIFIKDVAYIPKELIGMIMTWYSGNEYTHIIKDKVVLGKNDLDWVYKHKKQKDFKMVVYWTPIDDNTKD